MQRHPRAPHIVIENYPHGGWIVTNTRTGARVLTQDPRGIEHFVNQELQVPGYGLGDAVAAMAKPVARAFGMDPDCQPCAERQAALNRLKLW